MTALEYWVSGISIGGCFLAYLLIRAAEAVSFQHAIGNRDDSGPRAQVIDLDEWRHNRQPGRRHA